MAFSFKDVIGREWSIEIDGLLMGAVRDQAKVDLADLGGAGYVKLETDSPSLVAALIVLCRDQIKTRKLSPEEFSKGIRRDALAKARAAVMAACADFFPTRTWSEIQSRFASAMRTSASMIDLAPLLSLMESPALAAAVREALREKIGEAVASAESTALAGSSDDASAAGSTDIRPTPACDSPASVPSVPSA